MTVLQNVSQQNVYHTIVPSLENTCISTIKNILTIKKIRIYYSIWLHPLHLLRWEFIKERLKKKHAFDQE